MLGGKYMIKKEKIIQETLDRINNIIEMSASGKADIEFILKEYANRLQALNETIEDTCDSMLVDEIPDRKLDEREIGHNQCCALQKEKSREIKNNLK